MEDDLTGAPGCPRDSQIGTVTVMTRVADIRPQPAPLYNMAPPPGEAAEFAFDALGLGIYTHIMGGVNSAGEYELGSDTSEILARQSNPVLAAQVQLWGNPSDAIHDGMRGKCGFADFGSCPLVERAETPFLTMPSSCRPTLTATAATASWEEPANFHVRDAELEDPLGNPTGTDGCNALDFEPTIEAKPTTDLSDAPTGLDFNLHVPQTEGIEELATANFKDVEVALPAGIAVNPSGANGLGACSPAQLGLTSGVGNLPVRDRRQSRPSAPTTPRSARSKSSRRFWTTRSPAPSTSPSPTATPSARSWRSTSRSTTPRPASSPSSPARCRRIPSHRPAHHDLRRQPRAADRRRRAQGLRRPPGGAADPARLRQPHGHLGDRPLERPPKAPTPLPPTPSRPRPRPRARAPARASEAQAPNAPSFERRHDRPRGRCLLALRLEARAAPTAPSA